MFKVLSVVTVVIVGMLILGACASPAPTALAPVPAPAPVSTSAPATTTPTATAPAPTPTPAPTPAAVTPSSAPPLTYSNMRISPPKTDGMTVTGTVTVAVTNPGSAGTFPVTLVFQGDNDECPLLSDMIKNVTLAASSTTDVSFPVILDTALAARFTLKVGQLKGVLVK